MVSRLFFKGEKTPASGKISKVKKVRKKVIKIERVNSEELESAWISAISTGDLKGPIVIAFGDSDGDGVSVLNVDPVGNVTKSNDVSFQQPLPIKSDLNLELKINRVEPNEVSQVFVSVSITGVVQSNEENKIKLALKGVDGKYL